MHIYRIDCQPNNVTAWRMVIAIMALIISTQCITAQGRHVLLDSTQIWVHTLGLEDRQEGQPVLVFQSGLGTPMGNWDKVIEGASQLAPLLTYDRPGIGESEADGEVPTMKNVADRLVRLLKQLDIPPPYLLIGHSLGGLYVRGFPIYYPHLVAGLVIIDPADFTETHENKRHQYEVLGWNESRVDSLINAFIERRSNRHADAPDAIRQEGLYLERVREQEFKEVTASALPNIPVHILTGGKFDLPNHLRSKSYDNEALFRSKMQHRLTRWMEVVQSVDKGMLFYSGDAGHFVQWDDPELVISSIRLALADYELLKVLTEQQKSKIKNQKSN